MDTGEAKGVFPAASQRRHCFRAKSQQYTARLAMSVIHKLPVSSTATPKGLIRPSRGADSPVKNPANRCQAERWLPMSEGPEMLLTYSTRGSSGGGGQTRRGCAVAAGAANAALLEKRTAANARSRQTNRNWFGVVAVDLELFCNCFIFSKDSSHADEYEVSYHLFSGQGLRLMFISQVHFSLADVPVQIAAEREQVLVKSESALHPVPGVGVDAEMRRGAPFIAQHEVVKCQKLRLVVRAL